MIRSIVSLLIVGMLWAEALPTPMVFAASSDSNSERTLELLLEINRLLTEIQRLQQVLLARQLDQSSVPQRATVLHPVKYFENEFEATYEIVDGALVRREGGTPRLVDQQLWQLWNEVVDNTRHQQSVTDFRVALEPENRIGAFIELVPETGEWVLGVNRADFEALNRSRQLYQELFIHEYAHLAAYEDKTLVRSFTEQFWSEEDLRQHERLSDLPLTRALSAREDYFEKNVDRFISDYAVTSPDEDFAETFLEFVVKPYPTEDEEVYQKMRFLHQQERLTDARLIMRKNLGLEP